ncbi:MAG: ABC transporter substrate-binding protein, partial [Lachnospiraceae bacterium]
VNQVADGQVYGIPATANALGIVYNKKVFSDAGITTLPTTPDEFLDDLQKIKDNTDAIPLYTNYAAGWTLGAWDSYIGATATGDSTYMNQKLLHTSNPFSDPGDGTHPYNVYKILYDAVANGLTEDDYTTTDWEGSKGMMNRGEVATMVLGSWAVSQMKGAGDNPDDVDYMPFPISVDGKQYSSASPDYSFGINASDDPDTIEAAMIFVKWMTEESGFSVNEGGLPIAASDDSVPDLYKTFQDQGVTFMFDELAVDGEEDLMNTLNEDSELAINNGGNDKIAAIVENASTQSESFDDIMNEWNEKWTDAQETEGVSIDQ